MSSMDGLDLFSSGPHTFRPLSWQRAMERKTFPVCLKITAETKDKEIMGLQHKTLKVYGVQFHPESILTEETLV